MLGLLAVKALGLGLSIPLVRHHLSADALLLEKLCVAGAKVDCGDVLASPAARLFSRIPVAELGALYFLGGLVTLFLAGVTQVLPAAAGLLGVLALLALPYTVFSVYYQARVVRRWCLLCLGVQALLYVEVSLAAPQLTSFPAVLQARPLLLALLGFGIPAFLWAALRPLLAQTRHGDAGSYRYLRLRRRPEVIRALLREEALVPPAPLKDDFVLGSPAAPYHLTLLTHPECSPCADVHRQVARLLKQFSDRLSVTIRFLCPEPESTGKALAHRVLTLNAAGQPEEAHALLERWFDHPAAAAGPEAGPPREADSSLQRAHALLSATAAWAESMGVAYTPLLLLNGRRWPSLLEIGDLAFLLQYGPPHLDPAEAA